MRNKVKSVTKRVPQTTTIPDGYYTGTWGGYVIELRIGNEIYELETEEGVRGINVPVVVEVKEGAVSFETLKK